ncbi:hypothetical protein [Actinopolyspora mortivallis]|uniref:hypothetical protein n=1 Tax=Actinopolyspora mortivallis TaxID=33906 RepID=UPI0011B2020E|nr:hypothetical protein [Actinopolyspora mortivallis]
MAQDGFEVDKAKLWEALNELKGARDEAESLARESLTIVPGELTAKDQTTDQAREFFQKRMVDSDGSLWRSAKDIYEKIQEKIDAYEAVLGEYGESDYNADVGSRNIERRS